MTTTYGHMYLKSMNIFEVQEAYIKHGITLEVHAAGDNLIGRQIHDRAADTFQLLEQLERGVKNGFECGRLEGCYDCRFRKKCVDIQDVGALLIGEVDDLLNG